jgi:hypothetical protein
MWADGSMPDAVSSQIVVQGEIMTVLTDEVTGTVASVESAQIADGTEAKLTSEIKSLWSAHQTSAATAKRTKQELETLRFDLGCRLWELKAILVRTGRSGGWAGYLRSHGVPRATGERYIKRYEALLKPETNRATETISEPSEDDVRRLVRNLLPRLRKVLTTPESVSLFVDEVVRQLQASFADISAGKSGIGQIETTSSHEANASEAQVA